MHPRDEAAVDLCVHCGTRPDATSMEFPQALFEQPTVRASRWQRISDLVLDLNGSAQAIGERRQEVFIRRL
jgi:hypothetical protein